MRFTWLADDPKPDRAAHAAAFVVLGVLGHGGEVLVVFAMSMFGATPLARRFK
jgi:hypothetical protein